MSNDTSSLSTRTVRNVAWLGSSQAVRQVMAILTTMIVARFLLPADYGIFAMTLFVNELAQIFIDFGIGTALVQRKVVNQRMLATCFWINVAIGGVASLAVMASGPFVADYFNQPLVAHLLMVSAANLAVAAIAVLPQAILARELAFRHVAVGATVGSLTGAAATIVMAAAGMGVWALVFQPLIGTTVNLAYLLWKARWYPTFEFELKSVHGVLRFSSHVLASSVVGHFTRNLPHLILAPTLGASATGLLSMAMTVAWTPVAQFTSVAVRATFPVFAKFQDSKARMYEALAKALEVAALVTLPVLVGLALLAVDLMPAVFGAQWADTAPLVSLFCLLSIVNCITALSTSTLMALGRSDIGMKLAFLSLPVVGIPLWLVRQGPLFLSAATLAATSAFILLLSFWITVRQLDCGWSRLLKLLGRPMSAALVMAAAMWGVQATEPLAAHVVARMVLVGSVGALAYIAVTLAINRSALLNAINLIRSSLRRDPPVMPLVAGEHS